MTATDKSSCFSRQHVFRDLRPYLCTNGNCSNPEKMYATRHEWMYHEMQMHRRQWVCHDCHAPFDTKDLMVAHLHDKHSGSWNHHQLPVLMDICEAPLDEARIIACPMCPNELLLNRLLSHLAEHMEEISLFVLPAISEGDEDVGSHTMRGSRTADNSDAGSAPSETSLDFTLPDATERPPEYEKNFERIARLEEQDSYSKATDWNSATNEQAWKGLTLKGYIRVSSLSFSSRGDVLASGSGDGIIQLRDPATGSLLRALNEQRKFIQSVSFSPNDEMLASDSYDGTIQLWDPTTCSLLQTLSGHSDDVNSVAFSPNSQLLASGSNDQTIRLWDPTTGSLLRTLSGHELMAFSVAFSPNGMLLASASWDETVQIWNPETGALLRTIKQAGTGEAHAVAFSPDGALLAAGFYRCIKIWEVWSLL